MKGDKSMGTPQTGELLICYFRDSSRRTQTLDGWVVIPPRSLALARDGRPLGCGQARKRGPARGDWIQRWNPQPFASRRILDWFDPDDDRHLQAYEHYQLTGAWPVGFLPEGVVLSPGWDSGLARRIAQRWLRHREDLRFRAEGAE